MAQGLHDALMQGPVLVANAIVSKSKQTEAPPVAQPRQLSSVKSLSPAVPVARQSSAIVAEWNQAMLHSIRVSRTAPPLAARNLAMFSAAMHDAMVAVNRSFKPMVAMVVAPVGTSASAATAQAGYEVARRLYPEMQSQFGELLSRTLAHETNPKARIRGIRVGRIVGEKVWAARINDGSEQLVEFSGSDQPGKWRPTPPGFALALLPQWPKVKTMVKLPMRALMPDGFPSLASEQYAQDWKEVKMLGSADSTTRTSDQTAIARFWADGSGTFTPPGHWNQIAGNAAKATGMGFQRTIRMFALLNAALCDAGIACWASKYDTDIWRPVTAIREADTDSNAATIADPHWTPLLITPPFPSYVSGHSSFSGAASTVLSRFIGPRFRFEDTGDSGQKVNTRRFTSFAEAAQEAGMSRIYGGIHFRTDNLDGLKLGRSVALQVLRQLTA